MEGRAVTDDLVERVADVISMVFEGADITETAKGAIAIALEEAAKVVTEHYQELSTEHRLLLLNRAAAIRAMIKD